MAAPIVPCCFRCALQWKRISDDTGHCRIHGEYYTRRADPDDDDQMAPNVGDGWSEEHLDFVRLHLEDMTYGQIARKLQRTAKGVENVCRAHGWRKKYVRPSRDSDVRIPIPPSGLTPSDKVVARTLQSMARDGLTISKRKLAEGCGLSRRQVDRSMSRLAMRGMVEVARDRNAWDGDSPSTFRWVGGNW